MTKIDVFSGFLGAGKTTLLKKLIAGAYPGERLVLLENEFGEVGVDGAFMKETGIEISEINSGCICCSMSGDFVGQLKTIIEWESPDRVLIEPSGVAKLSDICRSIAQVQKACREDDVRLDSLVTVVDAARCADYMENFGEFFLDQMENAQCIVLSRTEGMGEEALAECAALVRARNGRAALITTPWDALAPTQIRAAVEGSDTLEQGLDALLEEQARADCRHDHGHHHEGAHGHGGHDHDLCGCGVHHHHGCGHDHTAEDVFASWGAETPKPFSRAELEGIGKSLEDRAKLGLVLRAKGIVAGREGGWYAFDYTPGEFSLRRGDAGVTGRLSVIGTGLNREALGALFGV